MILVLSRYLSQQYNLRFLRLCSDFRYIFYNKTTLELSSITKKTKSISPLLSYPHTLCLFLIFLAFDFCLFCMVIFHPRHNGQWPPTSKDFLSQILSFTFFSLSWFFRKSQYFPFNVECQTRELLVSFLLRLWYDAVLVEGFNPGPPALEASTLPLGYRGAGPVFNSPP